MQNLLACCPWLRFSLRTLLMVVTILGIWLGLRVNASRRQSQAVAELLNMGCDVKYDFEATSNGESIVGAVSPVPKWIISRTGPDLFHDISYVNLQYGDSDGRPVASRCTDLAYALDQVSLLPRPRHLVLTDQGDDEALALVGKLTSLELLAIWGNDTITDAGIQKLTSLHRLRELRIPGGIDLKLTDESLSALGTMGRLEVINIDGDRFSDEGLAHLRSLHRLRELRISSFPHADFTDEGLKHLESLVNLQELDLSIFSHVTDDGKRRLRKALPKLRFF
jgi:hypothetical protein